MPSALLVPLEKGLSRTYEELKLAQAETPKLPFGGLSRTYEELKLAQAETPKLPFGGLSRTYEELKLFFYLLK